jgi:hypothetical protein
VAVPHGAPGDRDLSALIRAYEVPDASPTSAACTSDLPDPRVVWLHTGRSTVAARAPRDACGKPTLEAQQAYGALKAQEVSSVKERQVTSQLSIDSTCPRRQRGTPTLPARPELLSAEPPALRAARQ